MTGGNIPTDPKTLSKRLRAVYENLGLNCEPISQEDAEIILEAVMRMEDNRFERSLCEALNTGDGAYRP